MAAPTWGTPAPYLPAILIKPDTVQGVRTYKINLVLDIVFGAFALTFGLASILITAADFAAAITVSAILGAAACGLIIVFVINFIVSLISVLKMHHGREEYGTEHSRYAGYGVLFKWLGTGMSVTAAVLAVYILIIGSAVVVTGQVTATVFVPLLITVFWTAGVACKGQMYRYFVRALQPPESRRMTDFAALLIPVLGAVGIGVVGWATVRVIDLIAGPFVIEPIEATRLFQILIGGVFLPPGLALVGYVILLTVYGRTTDRLMEGLRRLHQSMAPPSGWPGAAPPPWTPPAPASPPSTSAGPAGGPPAVVPSSGAPPGAGPPPPSAVAGDRGGSCPGCGKATTPGADFCIHCGSKLPRAS